ncbi:MAG: glycosyltransferase [Vicinamibacterales bacterium]
MMSTVPNGGEQSPESQDSATGGDGVGRLDVSLVLACYNEEGLIVDSVARILDALDCCRWSYEVVFVDDCSKDKTRALIEQLVAAHPTHTFQTIFHAENQGRGATVTRGMRAGRGAIVGYIDIDLEVDPLYVPACIHAIERGADVATGMRTYKFSMRSIDRYILSRGYIALVHAALGVDVQDTETGFKFFRKERILPIFDAIEAQHWFWDTEVMVRSVLAGLKVVEVPVLFIRRFDKTSGVRAVKDTIDYFLRLWRFRGTVSTLRREARVAGTKRDWIRQSL